MKLFQQTIAQFAAAALLLPQITNAADCTAQDQVFPWGQTAVNMMWSLRDWGCNNAWSSDIKIVPQSEYCFDNYQPCWNGWWYYHKHPTQQACWDTLEQIIDQCMWYKFTGENEIHSTNGGRWSHGNEYTEGWFYNVNGNNKREVDGLPDRVDANRTVHLALDTYGNVTGVAHDFQLQHDGTIKDVAAKN